MTSLVAIMITDLVPLRHVAAWRSYVGIIETAGRASGGPIGGLLTDTVGWRWTFLGQCPPVVLSILLVMLFVPGVCNDVQNGSSDLLSRLAQIDFFGSFLLGSTILTFLIPFEIGGTIVPWNHPLIYTCILCCVLGGISFVLVEAYVAKERAIMAPRLFLSRNCLIPNVALFGQVAGQLGVRRQYP